MLEINVNVSSPDIVQAIGLLVNAIRGAAPTPATTAEGNWTKAPQPQVPIPAPVEQAPVAPAPVAQAVQVPVSPAPGYTVAQVAKAGADLMQSNPGLQPALVELLRRYGAQTVSEIPQDKLGAFATELRQMGAKI